MSEHPSFESANIAEAKMTILAFSSISFLFFGSNVVMMSSYAEPQGELPPQLQQRLLQQQQQQPQQQGLSSNVTASPSAQQQQQPQQQDPPIAFQQGEEEEPCDGAYFVGPGGVTECM